MAAVALLLAGVLAGASGDGFAVRTGAGPLRVGLALEVTADPAGALPPLRWRAEGDGLVAEVADARLEATIRIAPEAAGFELRAEVRWRVSAEVARLAVRLSLPGPAVALGRDLRLAPLEGAARVDVGTPLLALVPGMAVVGGPGLAAAHLQPVEGGVELRAILDDEGAHPFAVYQRCLERLPPAAGRSWAALERKRLRARARAAAGDRAGLTLQLVPLLPGAQRPLVVERWPAGARAAIVFTDHADRTDPEALRALLRGSSPPAPAGPRGLLGHGLRITKSFFARDGRGGLLDDPAAARLAAELREAGSEVALHSPGMGPDDRAAVRAALAALAPWQMTTWIDHQPYTNCEALSNRGWEASGRWGIADLLVGAGFRWVWEANDLGGFGRPRLENLFRPERPAEADPPVYPLPFDRRLWAFQSTFFYGPPAELGGALSDEALEALEREDGLFVGHTYLSASARTTPQPEHRARLAVRPRAGGGLEIAPALEAGLARAGARVRAGTLASLTLREAAERLRELSALRVRYLPDGEARVEHHGSLPLRALTLAMEGEGALEVEGAPHGGHPAGPRSRVFFDLSPGEAVTLRVHGAQGPVPFLAVDAGATLER